MTTDQVDTRKLQRAQARVGEVLRGKWHLDRLLGVGGMASVYAATHRNGKRGAVKLLHPEWIHDEDASARFLQEGYAANTVGHPGVVSVLDDDVGDDGLVFLVMELLEGETADVRAAARPGQRLEVAEVVAIADLLLDVLAAAHEKGIIHRDIKPANLFLMREGYLKVLDFGIARLRDKIAASGPRETQPGNAIGTPAFMAREQARGYWSKVDARTDLWAVGATMFTLLTGRQVHQAETLQTLMLAAMTKAAPRINTVMPDIPMVLGAIIDRALAFEQEDRWPDARTMQRTLRELPDTLAPNPSVLVTSDAHCASSPPTRPSFMPGVSFAPGMSFAPSASQPIPPGMVSVSQATILPVSHDRERKSSSIVLVGVIAVLAAVLAATLLLTRHDDGPVRTTVNQPPAATAEISAPTGSSSVISLPAPFPPPAIPSAPLEPRPSVTVRVSSAAPETPVASASTRVRFPVTPGPFNWAKPNRAKPLSTAPTPPPKAPPARNDPLDQF